jgi:hypothetical protein
MTFKVDNVNDLELVYSILKERYPDKQVEVTFDYTTKRYTLNFASAKSVSAKTSASASNADAPDAPEVPVDMNIEVVYGDSVTGETPVIVKDPYTNSVYIHRIDSLITDPKEWHNYFGFQYFDTRIGLSKEYAPSFYLVWTDSGWSPIKKVIRHKTHKQLYTVHTTRGTVTVTEDHSLLTDDLRQIKPGEMKVGQKLLSSFPTFTDNESLTYYFNQLMFADIPDTVLNYDIISTHRFINHYKSIAPYRYNKNNDTEIFYIKTDKDAQKIYYLLKKCRYNYVRVQKFNDERGEHVYAIHFGASAVTAPSAVGEDELRSNKVSNTYASDTDASGDRGCKVIRIDTHASLGSHVYVYDLETASGRFNAGVGEIVVKNTDSVFLRFVYNHKDFDKNRRDTFDMATLCGEKLTKEIFNRPPIEMEFEKVFQPFVLLTKKRYIAKKFDNPKDPFQLKGIDAKGIALTRRDYCKMVKSCYKEIIDTIMDADLKNNVRESINVFYKYINNIREYRVAHDDLVVSAMLAKSYKSDNIAHVNLAKRLKERKEEVQVGDRIPYIFIETDDRKAKKSELAEDPKYMADHGLKFNRVCYLEQLAKPILGFYKIVLKDNEPLLDEVIDYVNDNLESFGGKRLKRSDFKEAE